MEVTFTIFVAATQLTEQEKPFHRLTPDSIDLRKSLFSNFQRKSSPSNSSIVYHPLTPRDFLQKPFSLSLFLSAHCRSLWTLQVEGVYRCLFPRMKKNPWDRLVTIGGRRCTTINITDNHHSTRLPSLQERAHTQSLHALRPLLRRFFAGGSYVLEILDLTRALKATSPPRDFMRPRYAVYIRGIASTTCPAWNRPRYVPIIVQISRANATSWTQRAYSEESKEKVWMRVWMEKWLIITSCQGRYSWKSSKLYPLRFLFDLDFRISYLITFKEDTYSK